MLSQSTINFELHAKVEEEIDLEMCSDWKLWEVQMLRDLDLGIGSRSHEHIQYVQNYQHAQPCDCSVMHY